MDKNKSTWKIWRLTKVLYFIITIPLVWFWAWVLLLLQEIHRWSYDSGIQINDYYIWALYMILFLISYILLTDLIRRIISYINNWSFNWFIPYIEILKRFFIFIIIIWWIISLILVSLSQNLRNECTWNNEWFNDYWICSCDEWFKMNSNNKCNPFLMNKISWEYSYYYWNDWKNWSIQIYPLNDNEILFYLHISKGAPSYNQWTLFWKVKIKNYYWEFNDNETLCNISFLFSEKNLTLKTLKESDCGFWYWVFADWNYNKISSIIPTTYTSLIGEELNFNR